MDVLCTDKLINYVVLELNKNNNREKIDSMIIDPVISHIMLKIHPYLNWYMYIVLGPQSLLRGIELMLLCKHLYYTVLYIYQVLFVEPDQLQSRNDIEKGQSEESLIENPVVVTMETVWNIISLSDGELSLSTKNPIRTAIRSVASKKDIKNLNSGSKAYLRGFFLYIAK